MVLIIAFLVLAVWSIAATFVELHRDGYRQRPTDWRRADARGALREAESRHRHL